MDFSVIIPVYGCKEAIKPLYERLTSTLSKLSNEYEIIMVNDGCPQNSWVEIEKICKQDNHLVGINLSRNFGQHRAILAAMDSCTGENVVVMDCDLQDRPEFIVDLYKKLCEGYDVVWGRRVDRKDTFITKFLSKSFYKVVGTLTDGCFDSAISNYSIAKNYVIKEQCRMREHNRDFSFFQRWLGFKVATIDLEGDVRYEGKSSYSLRRKINLAVSIITSQSTKPLYFVIYIGFFFVLVSIALLIYFLINYFCLGGVPEGWTSLIVSLYLVGGVILISLGTMGIYIGNIFEEAKARPLYVVSEVLNGDLDYFRR